MHILLLSHYFQPENVAPQRRWDELASRFIDAGHRVTVICPPPHYPSGRVRREHRRAYRPGSSATTAYGARVIRSLYLPHGSDIGTRTADHLVAAAHASWLAWRTLRGPRRPDVIIATAPGIPSLLAGRFLARRARVPLISEMRDAWPDLVTFTPGLLAGRGPLAWIKRFVHGRITRWQRDAARVVVTTSRFADVLASRGVADPVVIRNGSVLATFDSIPSRAPSRDLHVLYMGNMGRSQGLDTVVRAAATLVAEGLPLRVRFVGHGAERAALRRLNAQLGSPIEILDEVAPSEVFGHYAWADSLVVSLRDWEPFEWTVPSKLYESLATGKHVTGLLAGEAAEVVTASDGGDVVAPGDRQGLEALWRALLDDRERLRVRASGRTWIQEHASYDRLASDYLTVLGEALAR